MESNKGFIFEPGIWLGEGQIKLSISNEVLRFVMKWKVEAPKENGVIKSTQEVQIHGVSEPMFNRFAFSAPSEEQFRVQLESDNIGKVVGEGICRPNKIAWQFRAQNGGFEGFEMYELMDDGKYFMHAEYLAQEEFKTLIQGKIWKKSLTS